MDGAQSNAWHAPVSPMVLSNGRKKKVLAYDTSERTAVLEDNTKNIHTYMYSSRR